MPLNVLPSKIVVFNRDEIRDGYLRDYAIRNPTGSTAVGQHPYIDASIQADTLVPVYANAVALGNGLAVQTMSFDQLVNEAARLGTAPIGPVGASGYVLAAGSTGGGVIFAGDELKSTGGLRYQCTATGIYLPGAFVPVQGIDTGPTTAQVPGTVLSWSSPRPGISQYAAVAAQSNGAGLVGGSLGESQADLVARLISLRANPPASGNDAAYQLAIFAASGLAIQQAFTWPGILGGGTCGFTFTLRPSSPGQSRLPSATQLESVRSMLVGLFPKDDALLPCLLIASATQVALQVNWAPTAKGWSDSTTWPPANAAFPVTVSSATSALAIGVSTSTPTVAPQVGQTLGFYDAPNATFRRKRILTVAVVSPGFAWNLTFDTSNAASDTSYVPVVGQLPCPWSDSLQSLVAPIVTYFDLLGPGEQVASFYDPYRQRRSPPSPQSWPSSVTNRILQPLFALSTVADVVMLAPTVPYAPAVGNAGVSANQLTLGSIAAFP